MRIIFAGTPDFTIPILTHLNAGEHQLVAVYTKPDRRAGRGRKLTMSPVKQWARDQGLAVEQPAVWNTAAGERLKHYQPDLMIVAAYGMLLPDSVLHLPRLACVNVHLSLLPRWRGAAPVVRAIEQGDTLTGVSLMAMSPALDTGPVISQRDCAVACDDTAGTLQDKLIALGCNLLTMFLTDADRQLVLAEPQSANGVCYAPKLKKNEAWIDWHLSAAAIVRKVRAFHPIPMTQTRYQDMTLRVVQAQVHTGMEVDDRSPGRVVAVTKEGLVVCCGEGMILVRMLQPAGKRIMSAADFARGHRIAGECLR